jgi:hypothetical protein
MANLNINTTPEQDARIVVAFGRKLGLGRDATGGEVKADIIDYIKQIVRDSERAQAALAIEEPPPIIPA